MLCDIVLGKGFQGSDIAAENSRDKVPQALFLQYTKGWGVDRKRSASRYVSNLFPQITQSNKLSIIFQLGMEQYKYLKLLSRYREIRGLYC